MLLWLNGTQNVKGSPNENYAREMMELFTLGADRGAYTERDVREQARSLTGWRASGSPGSATTTSTSTRPSTTTASRRSLQARPLRLAGRVQAVRLASRCTRRSSCNKLWSYFVPTAARPRDRAALAALYRSNLRCGRSSQAILEHPVLYDGPRMVKPPIVHSPGCCAGSAPGSRPPTGRGSAALRAAALLPAERRGLGRHALARHRDVPRALDRGRADPAGPPARPARQEADGRRDGASTGRSRSGTSRRSRRRRTRRCCTSPARRSRDAARTPGSSSSIRCSSRTRCAS